MKNIWIIFVVAIAQAIVACGSATVATPVAVFVQVTSDNRFDSLWEADQRQMPAERIYLTKSGNQDGGVFLFSNRDAADMHFDTSRREELRRRYGEDIRIHYFEVPALTAGGDRSAVSQDAVVALVRVRPPWYAFDVIVRKRMIDLVDDYSALPALHYKYFTIADDDRVGGIYLWRDASAAADFYDADWHAAIEATYGELASVDILSATTVIVR